MPSRTLFEMGSAPTAARDRTALLKLNGTVRRGLSSTFGLGDPSDPVGDAGISISSLHSARCKAYRMPPSRCLS
jgi:hypothetical protein